MIFGVDIHPNYQAGINIEQIRREGFEWMAVKASQGTGTSWGAGARAWMARGDACGLISFPYHYLTTANVDAQARAAKAAGAGRPIMLDVEAGSGNTANVRAFLAAARRIGLAVPLLYFPRWYWQQLGSPSLAGMPPLVSSRYRTTTGTASAIFAGVPASFWAGYGGNHVAVLQFSDRASVAGRRIDVNAFGGTRAQFHALVYGGAPAPAPAPAPAAAVRRPTLEDQEMHVYTPEPAKDTPKKDWPRRTVTFGFDPAGPSRWGGNGVLHVHFGHRGGWIHKATWLARDTNKWSLNTPVHYAIPHKVDAGDGRGSDRPWGYPWICPPPNDQCDEIEIEFSAPDGMHVFMAYER